jgi:GTP 3',8-cyclase
MSGDPRLERLLDGHGRGEIWFIDPVSEPFNSDCNRVRLTPEGKPRTCRFSLNQVGETGYYHPSRTMSRTGG